MSKSRTQNSLRNMAYGVINRIVSIIFPFIVRTIFIKVLGEEYLGLNSLYSSILQVLNLADLGFASAIVASMYEPIANEDFDKVSALLNLYKKIYKVIGITILFIGVIITPFVTHLINGTPPNDINIYFLWILYLINTVVSYLFFAYKVSLINAHQRNDITEKIGAACRIIFSILQIIEVLLLKNLYVYVILTILNSVIYNLWCSIICDKKFPQYTSRGALDHKTKKKVSKDVCALALQKIGNTVSISLDSIVISAFLGLKEVAVYGNYYYIVTAVSTFINLIYSSVTASIGNSIATENKEKNLNDFNKFFFLNTWLVGWASICFICIFQDFMIIWMGKNLLFEIIIVILLVIRFYFEQIRKVVLTYKDAAGIWWIDKWRPIIGCIVNLILNVILVKYIGVSGVMISTIVSYAFIEIPWETYALFKYYFKSDVYCYYKNAVKETIVLIICGLFTYVLCNILRGNIYIRIVIKMLICMIAPNIMFIIINTNNVQYKKSMQFIRNIIKR